MIAAAVLVAVAVVVNHAAAATPPARPVAPARQADECPRAVGLAPGVALPAEIARPDGKVACRATAIPPADLLDLVQLEAHLGDLELRYAADTAALGAESEAARARESWWRAEAERAAARPLAEHPVVVLGAGVVAGVALTVLAGWALGQVAP